MEFYVPVAEMQSAIIYLRPVLNRGSDEISNLLMIQTEGNTVVFSATNNLTSVKVRVHADIKQQGQLLTPAKKLLNYLQTFSVWNGFSGTKDFQFLIQNDKFKVKTETKYESGKDSTRNFEHRFLNVQNFPTLPEFEGTSDFSLDIWELRTIIRNILRVINPEESRAALAGIYLALATGKITLAGTDGIHILEFQEEFPFKGDDQQLVLDYAFVSSLLSIFKDLGEVEFKIKETSIIARKDNVTLVGRLITDPYPQYTKYFEDYSKEIKLSRIEFLDNLLNAIPALNLEDYNRLVLKFGTDKLYFLSDGFKNEYILKDVPQIETGMELHMNGSLLNACIEALEGNDLLIRYEDNSRPLIFESPDRPSVKALLVTLRDE